LPDDRSFTYSLLLRALVRPFDSLWALVWWQTAAGVGTAVVVWHLLVQRLTMPRTLALVGTSLLAIEPAQLYYERMVLAETVGLFGFMLFFAAAAAYVSCGRAWWLPVIAVTGLATVTLRLNYLPIVLVISGGLPLIRQLTAQRQAWRRTVVHLAAAVTCVAVTHIAFQYWVAFIFKSPPGYIARTGFMQLALVMPLVTPEHLQRVGLPRDFGDQLSFPIGDPDARMLHQWAPGGFVRELRERGLAIEPVARPLARMAVRDDPIGLIRLGVHTIGNYFREEGIRHALDNDLGRRVIPQEILWTLREIWRYDATGLWARVTPVSRYFELGTSWLVFCLLAISPLALLNLWLYWRTPLRAQVLLVVLISLGLFLAHLLFVPVAFYRYLHPLPVFVLLNGALLLRQADIFIDTDAPRQRRSPTVTS
jgi:hypothetical protein